ncbi:hypothetical protein SH1V18_38540 [Vallitalea longa]|uniref:DUF4320 family protein n=1 Tax=Vallitalea longa TaxID=2936439 RepID=A0A9W5YG97_9FIRM|nr:DUF4320 family protein [Vallitalea longa]GKX31374.1 hypothetical protein SH1V18_38540 [Vallitalea longa]
MKILKSKKGEGYIDVIVIILSAMLVISLAVKVFPVFIAKNQLNTFADEILREAEISGQIGSNVNNRVISMKKLTGLNPQIIWSAKYKSRKKIQLNEEINVTVIQTVDIGLFNFGSIPIKLTSKAKGRSEVYWKE